jgi:hypothetical protein
MSRQLDRVANVLLVSYPPGFRGRYGDELRALVADTGVDRRVVVDLARGSARAWLQPSFPGDANERYRRRLQATVATVWVACCVGGLAVPGLNRALLDPPPPHPNPVVQHLLEGSQFPLFAAGLLAVVAGLVAGWSSLRAAVAAHDRRILDPLVPAVALGALETAGFVLLWLLRRGHPAVWPHPSIGFVVIGSAWVLAFAAFAIAAAVGPPVALVRAAPPASCLRVAAWCSTAAAAFFASAIMACVIAVVVAGVSVFTGVGASFGVVAAAAAVAAAGRGVHATRTAPDHPQP